MNVGREESIMKDGALASMLRNLGEEKEPAKAIEKKHLRLKKNPKKPLSIVGRMLCTASQEKKVYPERVIKLCQRLLTYQDED